MPSEYLSKERGTSLYLLLLWILLLSSGLGIGVKAFLNPNKYEPHGHKEMLPSLELSLKRPEEIPITSLG